MVDSNQSAHPLMDMDLVLFGSTVLTAVIADDPGVTILDMGGPPSGVAGESISSRFKGKVVVEVTAFDAGVTDAFITVVGSELADFSSGTVVLAIIPIRPIAGDGANTARGLGKHQQPLENLATQASGGRQKSYRYLQAFRTVGGTGTITVSAWLTKD